MNWFFLQIDTSAAAAQAGAAVTQTEEMNILDLLSKGGSSDDTAGLPFRGGRFCFHREADVHQKGIQDRR